MYIHLFEIYISVFQKKIHPNIVNCDFQIIELGETNAVIVLSARDKRAAKRVEIKKEKITSGNEINVLIEEAEHNSVRVFIYIVLI